MRRFGVVVALVLVALACLATPSGAGPPPAPSVTLEVRPTPVRAGYPVTLIARLHDIPDDYLPAFARFLDPDAKVFSQDVAFDANGVARLTLDPRFSGYRIFVFSDNYGLLGGPTTPVDEFGGYTTSITITTVPADPRPGDDVLVRVTVVGSTEGVPAPVPSGQVTVRSGGTTLGTGTLNNQGKSDVPVTLPESGAPITVGYAGDGQFVDSASAPYTPPVDPPPPTTPPVPPPASGGSAPAAAPSTTSTSTTTTTSTTVLPTTTLPAEEPEVVESAAAPVPAGEVGGDDGSSVQRSSFVLGIPSPVSVDWSGAHLTVNLLLALLLMLLTGIPSTLIDKTIEENYHRIVRSFADDEERAIHRAERWLQALPDPVLLAGLSLTTAVVLSLLDPSIGLDLSSLLLVLALAMVVALLVGLHDLARLPYLNRRFGRPAAAFGIYPFSLILAGLLVLVSRLAGFEPGYVFGIIGTLAVKETVTDRDEASTLAAVGVGFLGVAVVSWLLWHPIVDDVTAADPVALTVFLDAFLAGLWLTAIQAIAFGFAPLSFLDGGKVRLWSQKAWLGTWAVGMFLMVQFYLHPSAGRWGALDSTAMRTALSVWGVFVVGALLFWAWFRFTPDPERESVSG